MPNHPAFSYAKFAITVLKVVGVCGLFFIGLLIFAHFYVGPKLDKELNLNLPFAVPVILYLSVIFGWSIAYTKFFRFPQNQKLLLLGIAVGALVVPVLAGLERLSSDQMTVSEMLIALPEFLLGGLLGAAIQLYLLVVVLRYVVRIKLPF